MGITIDISYSYTEIEMDLSIMEEDSVGAKLLPYAKCNISNHKHGKEYFLWSPWFENVSTFRNFLANN